MIANRAYMIGAVCVATVIGAAVLSVFAPEPEDDGSGFIIAEADQCIADDPLFAAQNGGFLTAGPNLPPQEDVMFADIGSLRFVTPPLPEPTVSHTVHLDALGGYAVQIDVENFQFAQQSGEVSGEAVSGYALIYVNGEPVGRAVATQFVLPEDVFSADENDVIVALVDIDGRNWATLEGEPIVSTSNLKQPMTSVLTQ